MSDYTIILGYGVALLAGLLAIGKKVKVEGEGGQRTCRFSDCVEVRG